MDDAIYISEDVVWLMPLAFIIFLSHLIYKSWNTKEKAISNLKDILINPIYSIHITLCVLGLILFLLWMVSNGKVQFELLGIKSQWFGLGLAFTGMFGFYRK